MGKALYAAYFSGAVGQSIGLFFIGDGMLVGVDIGTMQYDGTYKEKADGSLECAVQYVVPAGTTLITGAPVAISPISLAVSFTLPANFYDGRVITIETPAGPINAKFEKLKDLP